MGGEKNSSVPALRVARGDRFVVATRIVQSAKRSRSRNRRLHADCDWQMVERKTQLQETVWTPPHREPYKRWLSLTGLLPIRREVP